MWPPVLVADVLYVIASDEIHALDAATGAQRWRVPFDAKIAAPLTAAVGSRQPAARSPNVDVLIATFDKGLVVAYATADGRMLWMRELGAASSVAPGTAGVRGGFGVDDRQA